MKKIYSIACSMLLAAIFVVSGSFNSVSNYQNDVLKGAWHMQNGSNSLTWLFIDGYAVLTAYDKENKSFNMTSGGPYSIVKDQLKIILEFNTADSNKVGQAMDFKYIVANDQLTLQAPSINHTYKRLDNGSGGLAGVWYFAGRLENGQINERQLGPRRTLKVLSGTRFQWIAINPSIKGFFGTGGGSYTFKDGKYTENIEFFPRDNSRVGASLTFDGKIENGAWMHSGLSSRGEPLNEIWKRLPKSVVVAPPNN